MTSRLCCAFLLSVLAANTLHCQSAHHPRTIHGRVMDAVSMEPLAGVVIRTPGAQHATQTNGRGYYSLTVDTAYPSLEFRLVGYKTRTIDPHFSSNDSVLCDVLLISSAVILDEVTVIGENLPLVTLHGLGATSISPRQTENIRGVFADAFRVVQGLPGVAANNEMSSQFSVRGGSIDQNLVLVNGVQMLEPFHLKECPNTGLGVVNGDILQYMLFIPGGFTARYGDRLSSVLDMEIREGNRDQLGVQADVSLINGSVVLEGPLSSWVSGLISFRGTYSDYIENYLVSGDKRHPSFYDVQGVIGADMNEGHHLAAQFLHSSDRTSGLTEGGYSTSFVAITAADHLSENSLLTSSLSTYYQTDHLTQTPSVRSLEPLGNLEARNFINTYELKEQLESRLSDWYTCITGFGAQYSALRLSQDGTYVTPSWEYSLGHADLESQFAKFALYTENLFQLTGELLLNAGIRLDHFTLTHETLLNPRILAAYQFKNGPTLKAAWGLYSQFPTYQQMLAAEAAHVPPQQAQLATHYTIGLEHSFRPKVTVRLDLYYKRLDRLISVDRTRTGELIQSPRNDAKGRIAGGEFDFRVIDGRVMAWINVAYMVAMDINLYDGIGWRYSPYDQRKTVTTVFEYRIAERWVLNLRAHYGSGFAYGSDLPGVADTRGHYPDYKRADCRISYGFPLGPASANVYLEIQNLFAFRNSFSFTGAPASLTTPDFNLLLPMVVNVGVKAKI